MAILKSKKSDIRSEIRAKIRKMDFQKILDNEVISNNIPVLLSYSTAPLTQVQKYITNEIVENNKALNDVIERKINEIISDNVIESIESFLSSKRNKENTEYEISKLKSKINLLNREDDLIEKCALEFELTKKEEELGKIKGMFVGAYKEGIEKSLIPCELYEVFDEVQCIRNEVKEEIEKEIDLMKAKTEALRMILSSSNILDNMHSMIEDRVNNEVRSKSLIESSKGQIPIVQVLMK